MNFNRACDGVGSDMEILVINLMRLGDLIQAGPVVRGLRAKYPAARLTLLVMDVFRDPARLVDGVDLLLLFPSTELAAVLEAEGGWLEACRRLSAWLEHNFSPFPDLVVNLSPTFLGAILAFAAGGSEVRGFAMNQLREAYTSPSWASYAMVVSRARTANPFNLVDLFVREAGLVPDGGGLQIRIPPDAQAQADGNIRALDVPPDTVLVGLLPGASRPERQWPAENFAQTALILRDRLPCHFFIFGSPQEQALGEAIRSRLPVAEVTDFQGRTSVPLLAAFLKRLHLLISNDTGPMHLAAAAGAPVLALFLATARALDTGPVGRGHLAIEPGLACHPCVAPCSYPRCHAAITPAQVAELGFRLLKKDSFHHWQEGENLRVFRAETDPWGYQVFLPMFRPPLDKRAFWTWVHRLAWIEALDCRQTGFAAMAAWARHILSTCYGPAVGDLGFPEARRALEELLGLASQGESLARRMVRLAGEKQISPALKRDAEAFATIDRHLRRLAVGFPEIASLVEFFFQEQRQSTESGCLPLARELARAYQGLYRLGKIFLQVAQELAKDLSFGPGRRVSPDGTGHAKRPGVLTKHQSDMGWQHAGDYQ